MRKLVVAAVASVAALTVVATASADVLLSANQQLHFKGKGGHSWNRIGGDSAYDSNTRALRMWVGNPSAGQYVVAYSQRSLSIAKDAAAVGTCPSSSRRPAATSAPGRRASPSSSRTGTWPI
jgi:hypothetical protein